jgi:Protein of unknown function (DUF3225)/Protein of unknown function (DUF4089)
MLINDPATLAEISALHEVYESALISNDVETLDRLFWEAPEAVRYGVTECLYGIEEIRTFRQNRPKIDLAREVTRLAITTLGTDTAIVNLEFRRQENGRRGRQTQFWRRMEQGWKIVSAHVSIMPETASYVRTAAARIGLPLDAAYLDAVTEDLERTAAAAEYLMGFALPQTVEAAPVFEP